MPSVAPPQSGSTGGRFRRTAAASALLTCLITIASCSGQPQAESDAAWLERFRGLSFDGDVPNAEPLPPPSSTTTPSSAPPSVPIEKDDALAQFGIVDGESDYSLFGTENDGKIRVRDDLTGLLRRSVIVHELSHVLDYRHPIAGVLRDDQWFGESAMNEGIARATEIAFSIEHQPVVPTAGPATSVVATAPTDPPIYERQVTDFYLDARYGLGAEVARLLRRTGGAGAVNKARSNPPGGYGLELLQPERYFQRAAVPPEVPQGIFDPDASLDAGRIRGFEWYMIVATQFDPTTALQFVTNLEAADSRSLHDPAGRLCTEAALLPRADTPVRQQIQFTNVLGTIADRAGATYHNHAGGGSWDTFIVCGRGLPGSATTTADLMEPILDRYWLIDIGIEIAGLRGVRANRLCVAARAAATIPPDHAPLWTDYAVYQHFIQALNEPCPSINALGG